MVLIAHNENGTLYFSATEGERITFDEFAQLRRDLTPHRAVVLITCNAGIVNQSVESLAEILIRNKLADTVFAAPNDVDAKTVPGLLQELSLESVGVKETLRKHGYIQIIFNRPSTKPLRNSIHEYAG